MRRGQFNVSLLGLRRRGRVVVLCTCLVVSIVIFSGRFTPHEPIRIDRVKERELRLSRYLSLVTPTPRRRAKPTTSTQTQALETAANEKIDQIVLPTPTANKVPTQVDEPPTEFGTEEPLTSSRHFYDENGLLTVNPDGPHPIYELIRRAEARWEAKQRRASRTLKQAVEEYERRYNRLPPKGFDHWWNYVQKHNVQLPDEYDQIFHDLEPYWGIDPYDLQALRLEREGFLNTYTIGKLEEDDIVSLLDISFNEASKNGLQHHLTRGAKPQMDLLHEVYHFIPPFRGVFRANDGPGPLAEWAWRSAATDASQGRTLLKHDDFPLTEITGWPGACPPDSPASLNLDQNDGFSGRQQKTFIYEHKTSMNPCYHPRHISTHGTFLSFGPEPMPNRLTPPLLSTCVTHLHSDIHAASIPDSSQLGPEDLRWEDKEDDRLYWRGSPTDMWHHGGVDWRSSQRIRLTNLTSVNAAGQLMTFDGDSRIPGKTVPVSFLNPAVDADGPVGEPLRRSRHRVNSALMDVSLLGPVSNCEPGIVCDAMQSELSWDESFLPEDIGQYKYVMDVDGDDDGCASSNFRQLMHSHALVFKSTVFPEWWTDRVQAWVHYVPVQIDYSDLYDSLVFFGGDLSGDGAHEAMAKKIASAGRDWVEKFWRKEDVTAYMFRLWLEYARVMSLDRDAMTFHFSG